MDRGPGHPLDYGYLKGTSSNDGNELDVWCGSMPENDLVACTVDSLKCDAELKLLLGCTAHEVRAVEEFHSNEYMSCVVVPRS